MEDYIQITGGASYNMRIISSREHIAEWQITQNNGCIYEVKNPLNEVMNSDLIKKGSITVNNQRNTCNHK